VIGDLSATIHLDYRDITGHQNVFRFTGLTLGKHRLVFNQPYFVGNISGTLISEGLHGLPDRVISAFA
jgi:hypothetical protein